MQRQSCWMSGGSDSVHKKIDQIKARITLSESDRPERILIFNMSLNLRKHSHSIIFSLLFSHAASVRMASSSTVMQREGGNNKLSKDCKGKFWRKRSNSRLISSYKWHLWYFKKFNKLFFFWSRKSFISVSPLCIPALILSIELSHWVTRALITSVTL